MLTPSMRRPVGVKRIRFVFRWIRFFSRRVATVVTLPSALSGSASALGASWVFSLRPVLPPDFRPAASLLTVKPGPGVRRSHRNSALLGFCPFSSWNDFVAISLKDGMSQNARREERTLAGTLRARPEETSRARRGTQPCLRGEARASQE